MNKPRFVISCPYDTYSGYGARSRDIVKAIIESDKYKVELLSQRWGSTSWGFCKDHPEWQFLYQHAAKQDWQKSQPELWMQVTIPNEFQPVGKYNIGLTAGIESTACKAEWIEGLNRMNMNWVSSTFAKKTFESISFDKQDKKTNQIIGKVKLEKPVNVIFEGVDLGTYKPLKPSEVKSIDLKNIKEDFCYLFVGHWMQGDHGHDRKNVGVLIKSFYDTFKTGMGKKPALILKSSMGVASYISRDSILDKIKRIKDTYGDVKLPNIYLISGEFDDSEMNELYNHPKVKAMVSFTKGEGFGRPLLEFATTGKPIIASGWSGHTDFLKTDYNVLLPGRLENVHPSAANDWLVKEAQWFQVDEKTAKSSLKQVYKHYKDYLNRSKKQKQYIKENFSWDKMKKLVNKNLESNVPDLPVQVPLNLSNIGLPKLNKI
jgi:glycosyltransferase involved in cell wall biosynthesis|tara:strand:- start:723 stop:2015 length:1293 start_codon:yes stop_codon:yes gene_type:complete